MRHERRRYNQDHRNNQCFLTPHGRGSPVAQIGTTVADMPATCCRNLMAKLTDKQRAALQMLAASARGYSLATMAARGFAPEMLHHLVRAGCATVHRTAFGVGTSKIVSLRITEVGRKAIVE